MCAYGLYSQLPKTCSETFFLILDTYYPDTLCLGNYMWIRGHFSKPKVAREQKVWKTLF
jgi:hypothetical protein